MPRALPSPQKLPLEVLLIFVFLRCALCELYEMAQPQYPAIPPMLVTGQPGQPENTALPVGPPQNMEGFFYGPLGPTLPSGLPSYTMSPNTIRSSTSTKRSVRLCRSRCTCRCRVSTLSRTSCSTSAVVINCAREVSR